MELCIAVRKSLLKIMKMWVDCNDLCRHSNNDATKNFDDGIISLRILQAAYQKASEKGVFL